MAIYIDDLGSDAPIDQVAVREYVDQQVLDLVSGAPAALNTLRELSEAINNDPEFAATLLAGLAGKLSLTGGTVTGAITLPGAPTQPLQAATKGYVDTAIANIPDPVTSLSLLSDVNVTNALTGQVLAFNGVNWYAADAGLGGDGTSISSAIVNSDGNLIVTLSTGDVIDAGYVKGDAGAAGEKGDAGAQGIQGLQGPAGVAGSAGAQGEQGPAGATGAQGAPGPQGIQGIAGPAGAQGAAGADGLGISSAVVDSSGNLILTLSNGSTINAGSSAGPKGDTGAQGPQGIQGPAGISYSLNGVADQVQVYGISTTTQPGFDLEVDLANSANRLTTARNIALTGKVTGLTTFDGSGNVTMLTALSGVTTTDVAEGTNQYFTAARARAALSAGAGISFNSSTGVISLNANSDQVAEGANNLYYTNNRFDNRLNQSNLRALADVANVTPATGQALIWNGNVWTPGTVATAGGSGGTGGSGVYNASVQVNYDASGNLSDISILSGGISAVIAAATSTVATVTFTFIGSTVAPLGVQIYGYQRTNNVYVSRALASDFPTRTIVAGGVSGSPTAFSAFDAANNTMTLGLTRAATGATAGIGQTTHCVIQFLLSTD